MKLQEFIDKFKKDTNKTTLLFAILVSLSLTVVVKSIRSTTEYKTAPELQKNLDVFLPLNFVLFPIEVENYEAVDSLLGANAFVKVYSAHSGKLLAENIKILRAPKAPENLVLLIPVNIAKILTLHGSIFRLTIQRKTNTPPRVTILTKENKQILTTYGN